MNQSLLTINEMVSVEDGKVLTNSDQVAKFFGKQHKHVLRAIRNLECSKEFASAHFWAYVENQQVGTSRRDMEYYQMDKDGFMFLVMGFTGKKAAQLKEAYINAFNWMYKQLTNGKDKLIKELQETINLERISFQNGSNAGRALNQRKVEKQKIRAQLRLIEEKLGQPDLFLEAGLC